jgi:hypothetical protein
MTPRSKPRIAFALALLLAALSFGALSAGASAHKRPGSGTPAAGKPVVLVGTVGAVDATARTFTLTVKDRGKHRGWRHHGPRRLARVAHHGKRGRGAEARTVTVRANELTLPAVGDTLLVKGTTQDDGTVSASDLRVLRAASDDSGDDDHHGDCGGKGRHGDDDDDDDSRGS